MNETPLVSIVVPTYNLEEMLGNCLASVAAAGGPAREVIVVDDASEAQAREYAQVLKAQGLCDEVVQHKINLGFAAACNDGVKRARGKYIVLLNNDTWVHEGWLEALVGAAEEDGVGIVGSKLLYPNGLINSAGIVFQGWQTTYSFGQRLKGKAAGAVEANRPAEVIAVTGACLLIKREVVDAIGLLDTEFYNDYEDVDWCFRAREAGYSVVYCPDSVVTHYEYWTRGVFSEAAEARRRRMRQRFNAKWEDKPELWMDPPVVPEREVLEVAYVIRDAGGRAACSAAEQVNLLSRRGHRVALFAMGSVPESLGVEAPVRSFYAEEDLAAELTSRPGVKVATCSWTAELVSKVCEKPGLPVYFVEDFESSHVGGAAGRQAAALESYGPRFRYLTDSEWVAKWLEKLFGYKAAVAAPVIDKESYYPQRVARAGDQICAMSDGSAQHDFQLTLDAYMQLGRPARLVCFGAEEPGVAGVVFVPEATKEQRAEIYNSSAVFLHTAVHESVGREVLEAMACGCVVVTTDANGNMAYCRDGENCVVIPKHDSAVAASMLERVLVDEGLQARLREGGLETAAQFDREESARRLEEFFRAIMREESRR